MRVYCTSPVASISSTVNSSPSGAISTRPKNWPFPSRGEPIAGPAFWKSTSGPKVPSISLGPKEPALIGPATNSQNGSKSVNAARSGE